jgi:murein DD-endopeptidase MepM/ murein hydrolase activator NlpD
MPEIQLCSPLEDWPLSKLPEAVVNPFHPPPPGSDEPHQGVDFADRRDGSTIALEGLPVQAVLSGQVASVIRDRFPYGNALLVETPLDDLPFPWQEQLQVPTPGPTLEVSEPLTCPPGFELRGDAARRSLYLLYAHMKEPVSLELGQGVACGQTIGAIGSSGNALNPHLHLEVRAGPSGANFSSMAHYDNSAALEEMANYCAWRVSGIFQLIDPLRLLSAVP